MDPELLKKALEAIKNGDGDAAASILESMIVAAASGDAAPPPADDAGALDAAADPPPPTDEERAALAALRKHTKRSTLGEAVQELSAMAAERAALAAERDALELDERRGLIAGLVKLGAETPATAWEGEADKRVPCKRLASEPIADLRARCKALGAKAPPKEITPPATSDQALSAEDEKRAANMTPAQRKKFEELRASRRSNAK
jgi:hypothetical protein